jgi:uncharacterized repeat protein (TIGR03803 family)
MNMGMVTVTRRSGWLYACAAFLFCAVAAIASSAQTFTNLASFVGPNGANPYGALVQGINGDLYGTASYAGGCYVGFGCGTIFEITRTGALSTLYDFCARKNCADGNSPSVGLVQGPKGNFYGTTAYGGNLGCYENLGCGTMFEISQTGTLTTLADSGAGALIRADNGNFYGVGVTLFKMTPAGAITNLYTFPNGSLDHGLSEASNGDLYVTTYYGGTYGQGSILQMTPAGKVSTTYSFCPVSSCTDGKYPYAPLVQGSDGNLYGTTTEGGASSAGTVFKITPTGKLTTLYTFCAQAGCADGSYPLGLIQATDGNLYGVAYYGGNGSTGLFSGAGTLYKITPSGNFTTLYKFCSQANCTDGSNPNAALLQATDGTFYGTTVYGGTNSSACPPIFAYGPCGTVFSLSTGLSPFVSLPLDSGQVGTTGSILGQGFTGTTGVFLNGTPASFTVVSDTFIRATVPSGATSGFVTVNTPSGTLTSNVPFRVTP